MSSSHSSQRPEDTLSSMFKFLDNMSSGKDITGMLNTLVRNSQINMLKQLRQQIDINIRKLTQDGSIKMEYDENLDPYKILGVSAIDTRETIDRAFKREARKAHPDRGGSNEAMVKVNAAYQAIKQFRSWK